MKKDSIDLTKINSKDIVRIKDGMIHLIIDGMYYKLINPIFFESSNYQEQLNNIKKSISNIEKSKLSEVNGVCVPFIEFYYNNQFVGYATIFLDGYVEFIELASTLDTDRKIDLLIKLSQIIKNIHEHNIAHTDIYNDNVLTDGYNIKIIDFDENHHFYEGEEISYFNSPEFDMAQINNLFSRLLIQDNKIITNNGNKLELPKKIKNYLYQYDINDPNHFNQTIKAEIPKEYPHDWLEELRNYINMSEITMNSKSK